MEKGEETGGGSPLLGVRVSDTIAKRCSASVHRGGWRAQCSRKAIIGGDLCAIHTPEGVAARKAKLHAKWDAQQKADEERIAARRAQEERQARALIVAEEVMPDLLAAAKMARGYLTGDMVTRMEAMRALSQAIALAEGRTS